MAERLDTRWVRVPRRGAAKGAGRNIEKVRSWLEKNKDLFGDHWPEITRQVVIPLADAETSCDRIPYSLDSGTRQVTVFWTNSPETSSG